MDDKSNSSPMRTVVSWFVDRTYVETVRSIRRNGAGNTGEVMEDMIGGKDES